MLFWSCRQQHTQSRGAAVSGSVYLCGFQVCIYVDIFLCVRVVHSEICVCCSASVCLHVCVLKKLDSMHDKNQNYQIQKCSSSNRIRHACIKTQVYPYVIHHDNFMQHQQENRICAGVHICVCVCFISVQSQLCLCVRCSIITHHVTLPPPPLSVIASRLLSC